jgi:hypothetical protein
MSSGRKSQVASQTPPAYRKPTEVAAIQGFGHRWTLSAVSKRDAFFQPALPFFNASRQPRQSSLTEALPLG